MLKNAPAYWYASFGFHYSSQISNHETSTFDSIKTENSHHFFIFPVQDMSCRRIFQFNSWFNALLSREVVLNNFWWKKCGKILTQLNYPKTFEIILNMWIRCCHRKRLVYFKSFRLVNFLCHKTQISYGWKNPPPFDS